MTSFQLNPLEKREKNLFGLRVRPPENSTESQKYKVIGKNKHLTKSLIYSFIRSFTFFRTITITTTYDHISYEKMLLDIFFDLFDA